MAKLIVQPKVAQFDHKVTIRIEGLKAWQKVTIRNDLENETGGRFESFAEYEADASGTVDLSTMPAINGTYTGVEPMGLFWSLDPAPGQRRGLRLLKQNASLPVDAHLSVLDSDGNTIAEENIVRTFMPPGMTKITVDEEGIKARLFIPPGKGPFPAVLDMYGVVGGLVEHRASLMASNGFIVLALAYIGYEVLPNDFHFEMEYFQKSVKWLVRHSKVQARAGIGVVGISKGGELAMYLSTVCPEIRAVVAIGSFPFFVSGDYFEKGQKIEQFTMHPVPNQINYDAEGNVEDMMQCFEDVDLSKLMFPFEKTNAHFLIVTGGGDPICTAKAQNSGVERLKDLGKHVTHLIYPSAGHLLEPLYTPFCSKTFIGVAERTVNWGGEKLVQMKAQEDMWPKMIKFLHENLQIGDVSSRL